jgi:NAD(P)H-quinone oxidoreductase subunit 5
MPTWPELAPWLAAAGPLALLAAGLSPSAWVDRDPRGAGRLALGAALAALGGAVLAAAGLAAAGGGPLRLGGAVYLDALSAVVLVLVAFVGAVVVGYSRNHLEGDPRHGRFLRRLCLTLAAVLTLAAAGNLALLAAAWVATSLALHGLLTFYRERPAAVLAARKKFVASRLGDACVAGAVALVWADLGTLDLGAALAAAEAARAGTAALPEHAGWIAGLLVAGALLKSAQFPFHGWLPEVMETPTPVSALLHAGIINAGGFLVARTAGLIVLAPSALDVLAVAGAVTAVFGSLVMLTQTSVKVALAWSTVAQMGFMLLQCGLGAFSAAVLHLVAHALYKAHAFLASGSVVEVAQGLGPHEPAPSPRPWMLAGALAAGALATAAVGAAFGVSPASGPGALVAGAVLAMGTAQLAWASAAGRPGPYVAARGAAAVLAVCAAYFALQEGAARLLGTAVPPASAVPHGPFDAALAAAVVALFGAALALQALLPRRAGDPAWRAAYVHLSNGLYANALADRLVDRWWPVRAGTAARP